uniref:Putative glucan endo-1,3-beta-D-glucosidase n=1 Tax=Davidia involucrata TaxID=16924 RepID=A0A5B7BRB7_DAVIN
MTKPALSLAILTLFLLLSFNPGGTMRLANGQKYWCVAKPSSSNGELTENIKYACDQVGWKNCAVIAEGGLCYHPNTLINHASVAMNIYYQYFHRNPWNCDFRNSGLTVMTNPSYGGCKYEYAE